MTLLKTQAIGAYTFERTSKKHCESLSYVPRLPPAASLKGSARRAALKQADAVALSTRGAAPRQHENSAAVAHDARRSAKNGLARPREILRQRQRLWARRQGQGPRARPRARARRHQDVDARQDRRGPARGPAGDAVQEADRRPGRGEPGRRHHGRGRLRQVDASAPIYYRCAAAGKRTGAARARDAAAARRGRERRAARRGGARRGHRPVRRVPRRGRPPRRAGRGRGRRGGARRGARRLPTRREGRRRRRGGAPGRARGAGVGQ